MVNKLSSRKWWKSDIGRAQAVFTVVTAISWAAPFLALLVYAVTLAESRWSTLALSCLVLAGALAAGGLLGFLFALPRSVTVSGEQQGVSGSWQVQPNTNLEDVSDWLTKIVVGITLVQLAEIPGAARGLFAGVGSGFGGGEAATLLAGVLIVYGGTVGLIEAWLATRLFIIRWMNVPDALRAAADKAGQQGHKAAADSLQAEAVREETSRQTAD